MILSQVDLRKAVADGEIEFEPPLEEDQWGEASVDLRLGSSFTRFRSDLDLSGLTVSVARGLGTIGGLNLWSTKLLRDNDEHGRQETYVLRPQEFVLALTHERVCVPHDMIALVEGRSTYARVGLSMHQTAPWIQPGWKGRIALEIVNHGPLNLQLTPLIDRPCQLTFFHLKTGLPNTLGYGSRRTDRYQDQAHPLLHEPPSA